MAFVGRYLLLPLLLLAIFRISDGINKFASSLDTTTSSTTTDSVSKHSSYARSELEVVQLNSRNLGKHLSDGNVWLINFYSPHCGHCVEFEPIYADIARHFHSDRSSKIKVGRVDGQSEVALTARFGIRGFPSFFIVDGWSVYEFEQTRIKQFMISFAEGGYKKTNSIPFYVSPMGPLGLMQAMLMGSGHAMMDFFVWTQVALGLSPIVVGSLLFGSMFIGCFLLIVLLALVIPPRQKLD